ncbi:MAG: DUF6159 family protein [Anaerolineales bacterium]|nr:DUF6159 family protein [Anaerolineales bacterium]MCX7609061.1 DUF6159 family protein [Anaerolineales bacterium]MDW8227134.1 DUF6159 family protein [Anaerolineales bacterium]
MDSFRRGWSFLIQAWSMARKDPDLIQPSVFALFAGFFVSLVFIPLVLVAGFLTVQESNLLGQVVLFVLSAIMIFVQFMVSYVFSAMTVYLIYGYLAEGDGRMSKAWAIVRRDFFDLLTLAAVATAVNLIKKVVEGRRQSAVRSSLANLIDVVWTQAAFLILPAMVIEDIGLKEAVRRVANIVKNNLLLIGISTVGVRAVNGLINFLLGALGIGLGFSIGLGMITVTDASTFGLVAGIGLGVLVAGVVLMLSAVITSYTATAYHTCLYLWAREVEKAQEAGGGLQVQAPAPLAAVLLR